VDFAGENGGGIYLDADWRGFFCGKKMGVGMWLILAGVLGLGVVFLW
jgi:hypothetical protein